MKLINALEKAHSDGFALTFDDVRLRTGYSKVLPDDVNVESKFSRNTGLKIPIISAAMDTVTDSRLAIEIAKLGGLGVIHKGMSLDDQIMHVKRVKYHLHGKIDKPICVSGDDTVESILSRVKDREYTFNSFPVLNSIGQLAGIVTGTDFDFSRDNSLSVQHIMSRNPQAGRENTTIDEAYEIMREHKVKILPLINEREEVVGMYTFKDLKRIMTRSAESYNLDNKGRLRVAAAVGVGEEALMRAEKLYEKDIDAIVIDTAHGDGHLVIATLKEIKKYWPALDIIAGNVSVGESAKRLVDAGADGIKVGQGPGSICTTRIVAGIGRPQVSAVYDCAISIYGSGVPICADGGITNSGDIPVAIAAGAHSVMLGGMLAATEEAPGEIVFREGRQWKEYRGMGSIGAMQRSKGSRERYLQSEQNPLVPEGIEGLVAYKGKLSEVIFQYVGGLRKGMGYVGASTIEELREKGDFDRITQSGLKESHPHDIVITKDSPNYMRSK